MPKPKRSRQNMRKARLARKQHKSAESAASSRVKLTSENLAKRERFRTRILPFVVLALISFLVYANAWPNELIWDDSVFTMGNRLSSGVTWADLGLFFTSDAWAAIGLDSGLYRPLLMASVSLDIIMFGEWKAGFHLINILLHTMTTFAVFGLIRYLLSKQTEHPVTSSNIALLAAIVFAVHPVHTEVVNSVFNRSEMLVTLSVVGGLWWFLPAEQKQPWKAWGILAGIYLLAMLSRETGIMLPAITVLSLWLISDGNWKVRLRRCLPVFWLLVPLAIYLAMRAYALDTPVTMDTAVTLDAPAALNTPMTLDAPIAPDEVALAVSMAAPEKRNLPVLGLVLDFGRVLPAISVWFDGLKLMVWPHPLSTFHTASKINQWVALTTQLFLVAVTAVWALKKKPGAFLGLMFFYLAILPASRIIGEASVNPHLAERYLYMPSVGFVMVLGFGLYWLSQQFSLKQAVVAVIIASVILTPLTWARNSKWASAELLAETDLKYGARSAKLTQALLSSLMLKAKLAKAASVCDRNASMVKSRWNIANYCGQVYALLGQYDHAEKVFQFSLKHPEGRSSAHYALAVMYLSMDRRSEASEQFDLAIDTESKIFLKEYLAAEALMRLYPASGDKLLEARSHMKKSIEMQPQYFHARKRLEDLDTILSEMGRQVN